MKPTRQTDEHRRQTVRDECHRRGIRITASGKAAFRLTAPGVDLLTTDLALVDLRSLEPVLGEGWSKSPRLQER